ncbi:MAG: hypothetical protein ACTHM5_12945 [Ginsengibacter sp.]
MASNCDKDVREFFVPTPWFGVSRMNRIDSLSLTPEQQQIELLKKELEDAKLQAEGYRRMIEIAESELKIPIRKKPNTK